MALKAEVFQSWTSSKGYSIYLLFSWIS